MVDSHGTRYLCEIVELNLQCQCTSVETAALYPLDKFEYSVIKLNDNLRTLAYVLKESLLTADTLPLTLGNNGAVVDATGEVVVYPASLAEDFFQVMQRTLRSCSPLNIPILCMRSAVFGPTPQKSSTGRWAMKSSARSGWTVQIPSGLR